MSQELGVDTLKQEINSGYLEFFELVVGEGSNNTLYFHDGKNENIEDIQFDGNTYIALPLILNGVEIKGDGAISRPTLTVANVESVVKSSSKFKTQMADGTWGAIVDGVPITAADFRLDDLIGSRLTRRRTLEKYLSSTPTVEFPKDVYIIDRVQEKNNQFVILELAPPFDLAGVRIPARNVIGKYCPWRYQGARNTIVASDREGGCTWGELDQITKSDGNTVTVFTTVDDEPILGKATVEGLGTYSSSWSSGNSKALNDFVKHNGVYWQSKSASNTAEPSEANAVYWQLCRVHTTWASDSGSTTYTVDTNDPRKNSIVYHSGNVWRALRAHTKTATYTPELGSTHWARADVCGKLLHSCKMRYQAKGINTSTGLSFIPSVDYDTTITLPFGGFPGSRKFT